MKNDTNPLTRDKIYNIAIIFILTVAFSPAILTSYAYTDDWVLLYNSINDKGAILKWDLISGRPLYGIFQYLFSFYTQTVDSLIIVRAFSIISIIYLSFFIFGFTQREGIFKCDQQRLIFSISICLLPSFQVYVGWASCAPYVLSVILAGFSYQLIKKHSVISFTLAFILLISSFCIYQPAAMSFTFFVFIDTCMSDKKVNKSILIRSAIILFTSMLAALFFAKIFPSIPYGETLHRTDFTNNIPQKLYWFCTEYLKNSICNFDISAKPLSVIISFLFIWMGLKNIKHRSIFNLILAILMILSSGLVSLISVENWASYRTTLPTSLIFSSLFISGLFYLIEKLNNPNKKKSIYLFLIALGCFVSAYHLHYAYSVPAKKEFRMLESQIKKQVTQDYTGKLYYRLRNEFYPSISIIHKYDDFGGLGLGMPWVFKGMAYFIKNKNKMDFLLTDDPVIVDETPCPSYCIVIDARDILMH